MCFSSSVRLPLGGGSGTLQDLVITTRAWQTTTTTPPLTTTGARGYSFFRIEPDTWLRTMLVFYTLNARLNHLAGDWPQEYWMTQLPQYVKERPLTQLSIPGSHDSFAYWLDTEGPLAPDLPPTISMVANLLANLLPTVKVVMHNWSKTQQLTFTEQLTAGVRYFDIRVGYFSSTKQLYFLHGLWGKTVQSEISKLPAFLDSHPGEVVILDFNHLYLMLEQDHASLADIILATLGHYLIPFHEYCNKNGTIVSLKNLTLANLAKQPGRQVIVSYQFNDGINVSKSVFWPGMFIQSVWPETNDVSDMIRTIERSYRARVTAQTLVNSTEPPSYFFVYQGILTPDADTIASNLLGSLYDSTVPSGTSSLVNWLATKRNNQNGLLNICIVDGVETFNFLPAVVALNIF